MRFAKRSRKIERTSLSAASLLLVMSACGSALESPTSATRTSLAAQQHAPDYSHPKHLRYILKDLGPSADRSSNVNSDSIVINEKGTVAGGADTSTPDLNCARSHPFIVSPNCLVSHAVKWQGGIMTDLGALPGGSNSFAIELNSAGVVGGISENGLIDPLTGFNAFVATVWKHGEVTDLGTLGGAFSLPSAINDRRQLVGGAQNTIPASQFADAFGFPSGTQWRAVLWHEGVINDLGTLGDGQEAFAFFNNERGQVAGVSFTSTNPSSTTGIPTLAAFIWDNGKMTDLGSLGGTFTLVSGMNNRGQVTGVSNLAGDEASHAFFWSWGKLRDLGTLGGTNSFGNWINDRGEVAGGSHTTNDENFDAFIWRNGVMTDLGRVAGDLCSNAFGINSKSQIVGQSACRSDGVSHAFISENGGPVIDLNTLVPSGTDLKLTEAKSINDRGEIVGTALLPNGQEHAFLLIPREDNSDGEDDDIAARGSEGSGSDAAVAAVEGANNALRSGPTAKAPAALRAPDAYRSSRFGFGPAKVPQ
jgi:probable HAF family extracellular repeat protein